MMIGIQCCPPRLPARRLGPVASAPVYPRLHLPGATTTGSTSIYGNSNPTVSCGRKYKIHSVFH
jgi:hypothetical protein